MNYSEKDLKTIDAFAFFLVILGAIVWLIAVRPYLLDSRHLTLEFGVAKPFIFVIPAILGSVLIVSGSILNIAIRREQKKAKLTDADRAA